MLRRINKRRKHFNVTNSEYKELKERLLQKRNKGNITNREQGYNEGIECAVSMIREVYKRQFKD